jgi:hypothetical protein
MPDEKTHPWPDLPLDAWRGTYRSLHMWTQVVGKTLLGCAAPQNHWWHCALRVSARGLASATPIRQGERSVDVELDLVDHALVLRGDGGRRAELPLVARSVHAFHDRYLELLRGLGIETRVWTTPVEVPDPVAFDRDDAPGAYDPAAANGFWQVLRRCDAALKDVASGYLGKQSPVQFFWGSFDLAWTRFSGRRAPERPGADRVTREAYSHEVVSVGFWPGGVTPAGVRVDEPVLYGYAAPEPAGFREVRLRPAAARYDERLGEFVLPYAAVRAAPDPAAEVRAFADAVYVAGATLGGWDRAALERAAAGAAAPAR